MLFKNGREKGKIILLNQINIEYKFELENTLENWSTHTE